MHVGIFAKTFKRATLEETLNAVQEHGIRSIQFNMSCAGLPSLPESIDEKLADRVCELLCARGIVMAAVSGTFNMIHPDHRVRGRGLKRLRELARSCKRLGTSIVTLSTGTRDPEDMWRSHRDNDSPGAWADMRAAMAEALHIAAQYQLNFAFEPELSNVVDSARKARRLLDEMQASNLKVVIDPANLFHKGDLPRMAEILDEAFSLLGDAIVLAHAKDLSQDGAAGQEAAGTGRLDYDRYIGLLDRIGYRGPLILHGLTEEQVDGSATFLRDKLRACEANAESHREQTDAGV